RVEPGNLCTEAGLFSGADGLLRSFTPPETHDCEPFPGTSVVQPVKHQVKDPAAREETRGSSCSDPGVRAPVTSGIRGRSTATGRKSTPNKEARFWKRTRAWPWTHYPRAAHMDATKRPQLQRLLSSTFDHVASLLPDEHWS